MNRDNHNKQCWLQYGRAQPPGAAHHDGLCAPRLQHVHLHSLAVAHVPRAEAAAVAGGAVQLVQLLVRTVPPLLQERLTYLPSHPSHRAFLEKMSTHVTLFRSL